ncbi:hypothetical protein IPJ70_02925 [Candidatus Campbellbacteria bacterium]|nr:MAG: hypothetical protein IPJ70_02925 [Candidatus Campbellbacteria bacterium]
MKWLIPISILVLFELIADVLAKNWSLRGGWLLAGGALIAYFLANTFWLFALQNGAGLARGAVIFSVASAILAVALGLFVYHEPLTYYEIAGVLLGLLAITLIFWK